MSDSFVGKIKQNITALQQQKELPLLFFDIIDSSFTEHIQNLELKAGTLKDYAKFADASAEAIQTLRIVNFLNQGTEQSLFWNIKLLRFCEVRYKDLHKVLKGRGLSKTEIVKIGTLLCSLFMEVYLKTGDLKFFNTALKLIDCNWLQLTPVNPSSAIDVLYFRNLEIEKQTLKKISNG